LFREGRLADAIIKPGPHLAEVLVRFELLPLQAALDLATSAEDESPHEDGSSHGRLNDHATGRLSDFARRLDQEDVAQAVDAYLLDALANLVKWRSGTFSFREADGWKTPVNSPGIDVASALLRVAGEPEA